MSVDTVCQLKNGSNHDLYGEPPPPYPGTPTQVLGHGNPPILLKTIIHEDPVNIICPYCKADIVTSIRYKTGKATWLASGILCFIGFYLGCCLLPFLIKGCKDVVHSCPKCHTKIATYDMMQCDKC